MFTNHFSFYVDINVRTISEWLISEVDLGVLILEVMIAHAFNIGKVNVAT
jgi:hypothetical protein